MKKYQIPRMVAFLWVIVSVTTTSCATAQAKKSHKSSQLVYMQRQANYNALVNQMRAVRQLQAPDSVKGTASFRLATLYTKSNIYPTKSSVALIYKLNPELDASKPIPEGYEIRTLHFTPAPQALLEASLAEYERLKVPSPAANDAFFGQSKEYDRMLGTMNKTMQLSTGLADTMKAFGSVVLPNIHNNADRICEAQMQYFSLELGHILRLMDQLLQQHSSDGNMLYSINQMIGDFMEITGWKRSISIGDQHVDTARKPNPRLIRSRSAVSGGNEFTLPFFYSASNLFTPWANPPNVDIYVFRSTSDGGQDSLPSMNAFDVYYDSNGYIYSLTAGCDTLSFFSRHPLSPASTLPLTLGKGNYCFVLKDRKTGKIYLQPDVNLAVNRDYDEKDRVIIPFYIEED